MSRSKHRLPLRTRSATGTRVSSGWRRATTRLSGAAFLFAGLLVWAATAHAQPVTISSADAQVVFNHHGQACDALDIPDAPARAIRLVDGSVQLYAPHFSNRHLQMRLALIYRCGLESVALTVRGGA